MDNLIIRTFFNRIFENYFKVKVKKNLLSDEEWSYLHEQSPAKNNSSHWDKYLEYIKIDFIEGEKVNLIQIEQLGLADLTKLTIRNILIDLLSIIRNVYLYFKYSRNIKIFIKIVSISILTKRVICFDMIKHGLLISRTKFLFKDEPNKSVVIIGDGFGFLGILIKTLNPSLQICYVNLRKNLFLDLLFYKIYFGHKFISPKIIDAASFTSFPNDATIIFNVASFAEMTENSINQYLEGIQKTERLCVSLNRQGKKHPNGDYLNLNACFDKYSPNYLLNSKNVQWYSKFPTNKFCPAFLPFDGPIDLKVYKI
jgi:hypothetical protein